MKKILMLGPFPIGDKGLNGQSIANKTLYDGLKEKYDVKFVNTNKEMNFTNKTEQGKFKILKFLKIVLNLIFEITHLIFNKYDVVYITPGQSFLGFMRFTPYMFINFLKNTPCYIHIHGGRFRKMYDNLSETKKSSMNYFLKKVEGVIVLGKSLKKMFQGLIDKSKIFVCENGVEDYIIATEEEIEEKVLRFNERKKKKVLYLSNLMKEKGILELLRVSEKFNENEIEFNLAGAIEPEIENIIKEYLREYPEKIKYHGVVSGNIKKKLFLENDIFVLPSWDEGQPISILEAYATGCSVVTTDVGGILDIFEDNKNGILCQKKDIESLYEVINKIKDDSFFIKDNYNKLLKEYTSNKFIEKIEEIALK